MLSRPRPVVSFIGLFLLSITAFAQNLIIDTAFTPTISGGVNSIKVQNDQKILIAGGFSSVNGVLRQKIARLNADGSLDTSFNAGSAVDAGAVISSMKILPDGKILLGGYFGNVGTNMNQFSSVLRLNADGTLDNTLTSFPYTSGGAVRKAESLSDGKILLCGDFTSANGIQRYWLARYNFDGSYDASYTTEINGSCQDVEIQPDGKYLIAGYFTSVNSGAKTGLARFNSDDSLDSGFNITPNPNSSSAYFGIELQTDGKILGFQANTPYPRRMVRLNADGSTQTVFAVQSADVRGSAVQVDGKPIIVGNFNNSSNISNQFNRFNTDGSFDLSMNQLNFCCNDPWDVAIQADGKIIVGGFFNTINGVSRPALARLMSEVAVQRIPKYDFDGDGKADVSVFRPSDRIWYLNRSSQGFLAAQFGLSTDIPVAADYDGDGKSDIAVFRDGVFYYLRSSDSSFFYRSLGQPGDIPQPGNYWSTEAAEFVVYRPSTQTWHLTGPDFPYSSWSTSMNLELPTDIPVANDFDGDGRNDLAIFRDGNWFHKKLNSSQIKHYQFGLAGDKPVAADYDGDGRADYAVFRPSNGVWYIQGTTQGFYAVQWGLSNDIPVPADYDGDGKTDIAVYRNGIWYQLRSNGNSFYTEQFGLAGDIPAPMR